VRHQHFDAEDGAAFLEQQDIWPQPIRGRLFHQNLVEGKIRKGQPCLPWARAGGAWLSGLMTAQARDPDPGDPTAHAPQTLLQ
jgi:hypothetical protein